MKRLLIPLLGLWLLLQAGLFTLLGVFRAEREEGRRAIRVEREARQSFASRTLAAGWASALVDAGPAIQRAAKDPLAPSRGLYWWCDGAQLVPPASRSAQAATGTVAAIFWAIKNQRLAALSAIDAIDAPGSPWSERLALSERFIRALKDERPEEIEASFRAVLAHRERHALPPERDLPLLTGLLELLGAEATPDPALLAALLRDGLPGGSQEGLFRALLSARGRIAAPDLSFLAERLIALAESAGVRTRDFKARLAETPSLPRSAPAPAPLPRLESGRYLDRDGDACLRGIDLELDASLARLNAQLLERGLLDPSERISLRASSTASMSLGELPLVLQSGRFSARSLELDQRFRIKTGLLLLAAILATLTVVLAVISQRRKLLFIEQKSDFLTTVSHELRTPLASIRVMAETLERKREPGGAGPDYPTRIVREIDGLSGLVENILSFNRLDKGRWVPRKSTVDLEELITDLVPDLSTAEGRVLELQTEGLDGCTLDADPELLKLLFTNLLRNACRYNARDPVKVHVQASPIERGLAVEVSDNGIGIPEEDQPKLFTEFVRAGRRPADRTVPGSGLGLAIARRVMVVHGGTIQIKASSAEGTTFELRFR